MIKYTLPDPRWVDPGEGTRLCLFCCNHTCYRVGIDSATSASRYVTSESRFQRRSSMYIQGLIPRISMELAKAVPIDHVYEKCGLS